VPPVPKGDARRNEVEARIESDIRSDSALLSPRARVFLRIGPRPPATLARFDQGWRPRRGAGTRQGVNAGTNARAGASEDLTSPLERFPPSLGLTSDCGGGAWRGVWGEPRRGGSQARDVQRRASPRACHPNQRPRCSFLRPSECRAASACADAPPGGPAASRSPDARAAAAGVRSTLHGCRRGPLLLSLVACKLLGLALALLRVCFRAALGSPRGGGQERRGRSERSERRHSDRREGRGDQEKAAAEAERRRATTQGPTVGVAGGR
jgi:hypothetical protein